MSQLKIPFNHKVKISLKSLPDILFFHVFINKFLGLSIEFPHSTYRILNSSMFLGVGNKSSYLVGCNCLIRAMRPQIVFLCLRKPRKGQQSSDV